MGTQFKAEKKNKTERMDADFLKQRHEKDMAELKKLCDAHFKERKADEEELAKLAKQIEDRKEYRKKQIEDRKAHELAKQKREKEEKERLEAELEAKKLAEEEKKKEALAAMSMNFQGYLAKKQAESRNRKGGADKEKKKKILSDRRKPLNVDHMDSEKLVAKANELWKWLYQLEFELVEVQTKTVETKYWLNMARNRFSALRDTKQRKKR